MRKLEKFQINIKSDIAKKIYGVKRKQKKACITTGKKYIRKFIINIMLNVPTIKNHP